MKLGTLITRPLQDNETLEVGSFMVDVYADLIQFNLSGDKKGYVKSHISSHLAIAVEESEVPVEYWAFTPTAEIMLNFDWPDVMPFNAEGYYRR